ncbi:uncharacterized protein B4U80_13210 [Leptotrombidium deliense]|uniref:Ras-GEF domain-containing protein n=1 Tax=Leptotrombidium deliense TaxID=299467 RepID=A0A443SAF9_9ACAR|nr:uncharacterized protein B4U80_13210 [Leptotrombidium deliense]
MVYKLHRKRLKSIFEESEADPKKDVIKFGLLPPSSIAFTLTIIVKELFLTIKSDEVFRMLSSKAIDQENCPGITALLGFQKRILNLLTTSILDLPTVQERSKRIAFLIEVAEQLRFIGNWQSVFSIISSCQSPPIARLKHTWSYFFQNYSDHYREFLSLSREIMETNVESENTTSSIQCIPIFDKWLHQLKQQCTLTTDKSNDHSDKGHWQKPETIALWLNNEIITLEKLALEGKSHKKMQEKKKGIVHKIKKTFSHKPKNDKHDVCNISESFELSGHLNVNKSEINSCDKKSLHNKDNRQASQAPNTSDDCETRKFRIITDALSECHMKLVDYNLENNETARNFLLLQPYRIMDENMSISYTIEPVHR